MTDEQVPDYFRGLLDAGFTPDEPRAIASEFVFAAQMGQDFHQNMRVNLEDAVDWTPEKRIAFRETLDRFLKGRP